MWRHREAEIGMPVGVGRTTPSRATTGSATAGKKLSSAKDKAPAAPNTSDRPAGSGQSTGPDQALVGARATGRAEFSRPAPVRAPRARESRAGTTAPVARRGQQAAAGPPQSRPPQQGPANAQARVGARATARATSTTTGVSRAADAAQHVVGHLTSDPRAGAKPGSDQGKPTPSPGETGRTSSGPTPAEIVAGDIARVEDFFRGLGRDGWDGRGGRPNVVVDASMHGAQASIRPDGTSGTISIGSWDKRPLWTSPEVAANEYTHLVVSSETRGEQQQTLDRRARARLDWALRARQLEEAGHGPGSAQYDRAIRNEQLYAGLLYQPHAINEGLSDVMSAAFVQDWNIAGLQDPSHDDQSRSRAATQVATSYRDVERRRREGDSGATEPHHAGGIVSNAAAEVQRELGWDAMTEIFYGAMVDERFTDATQFRELAGYAADAAHRLHGADAAAAVRAAFADNGVRAGGGSGQDRPI